MPGIPRRCGTRRARNVLSRLAWDRLADRDHTGEGVRASTCSRNRKRNWALSRKKGYKKHRQRGGAAPAPMPAARTARARSISRESALTGDAGFIGTRVARERWTLYRGGTRGRRGRAMVPAAHGRDDELTPSAARWSPATRQRWHRVRGWSTWLLPSGGGSGCGGDAADAPSTQAQRLRTDGVDREMFGGGMQQVVLGLAMVV